MRETVYLDYNATSPARPAAVEAVRTALAEGGNASSVHGAGRAARARLEAARGQVAALAGADPADLIFTSGATEADNLALRATGAVRGFVGAHEHDAVLAARPDFARLPVAADGGLDLPALERALAEGDGEGTLVSLMAVNNETGVIQPVAEAAALARAAGARLHVDAAQAPGRVDLAALWAEADMMSLSAHKIGGPPGVGALLIRPSAPLTPESLGGGQERRRRAGTENLPGIAGFGAAAEAIARDGAAERARIATLRERLEAGIADVAPRARIAGADAARVANTCCVALPGFAAEKQVMALDLEGIAVSAGSACSSGKVTRSHVLSAMGWPNDLAGAAIRVSLGWATTDADIERFLTAYAKLARKADAA